jgi:hypothetical protein
MVTGSGFGGSSLPQNLGTGQKLEDHLGTRVKPVPARNMKKDLERDQFRLGRRPKTGVASVMQNEIGLAVAGSESAVLTPGQTPSGLAS